MVLEGGKEQSHFVALEGGKEQGEDWCILPTASQSVSTIWSDKNQLPWELKAKKVYFHLSLVYRHWAKLQPLDRIVR